MIAAVAAALEGVVQIEVVSGFVGEGASVADRCAAGAHLVVADHNPVLRQGNSVVGEGRIPQNHHAGLRARQVNVPDDPNVEVFFVVPPNHAFHVVARSQRQRGLGARDSVGAFACGVHLRPHKFNVQIRCARGENRPKLTGIAVQPTKILVQPHQSVLNLRVRNVVGLVVVHHVEDHGDGVDGLGGVLVQSGALGNPPAYFGVRGCSSFLKTRQRCMVFICSTVALGLAIARQRKQCHPDGEHGEQSAFNPNQQPVG